ncbi:hypothetical protein Pelsub_P2920 [Pelolinea submarina]|nr:hypothetical protein Pelsub_P2920 [Pelolinea submarina]
MRYRPTFFSVWAVLFILRSLDMSLKSMKKTQNSRLNLLLNFGFLLVYKKWL